jgi:hypothetical protein
VSKMRMQLWTDETQSEYKITIGSNDVTSTSSGTRYTRLVDEMPFVDGYDHDWSYTLSQWVIHYLLNKCSANKRFVKKDSFKMSPQNDSEVDSIIAMLISRQSAPKPRNKILAKPGLKCRFCNLKYCLEIERKEHEEFWHSNKLIKI